MPTIDSEPIPTILLDLEEKLEEDCADKNQGQ